jgi:hypothetical protein
LWTVSRAPHGKTGSGIPNRLNYVIFIVHTNYTNVTWAAKYNLLSRGLEIHGVKDLPFQGRDGILKVVYFLKNYTENDVVISEVNVHVYSVLNKEKKARALRA